MSGSDPYDWLQSWYVAQCNGDWEHRHGIRLETMDNPGWLLTIDLVGTPLEGKPFQTIRQGVPCNDLAQWQACGSWRVCEVAESRFKGACGPLDLAAVIDDFRRWSLSP